MKHLGSNFYKLENQNSLKKLLGDNKVSYQDSLQRSLQRCIVGYPCIVTITWGYCGFEYPIINKVSPLVIKNVNEELNIVKGELNDRSKD